MENISWIVMLIIEIFLYINLAKAIYGKSIKITKNRTIAFMLVVGLLCIIDYCFKLSISSFSVPLGVFIYSDTSIKRRIFNSLTVLIIAMGIQEFSMMSTGVYSVGKAFYIKIQYADIYYIILMTLLIKGISFFRDRIRLSWREIPLYIYINVILGFSAGIIPLDLAYILKNEIPMRAKSIIFLISYLAIALNLFSIYLFVRNYQEKNKYGQESKEKSELMKVQAQYLENTVKNYEYLKAFRHDMKGHLRTLETMCEDNPKALSYIEEMGERINSTDVFKCSNPMVSAVLNTFGNELNDEGIHHSIHYLVGGELVMDDLDICSLLYNLTNNALEAERKVNKDYKEIEVQIKSVKNHLLIYVYNDVNDDFDMENVNKKQTTKKDKIHHGIGLQNIDNIAKKYLGQATYSLDDNGRFEAEVILQDVVKYYY